MKDYTSQMPKSVAKKPWVAPKVELIKLDYEISLVMTSDGSNENSTTPPPEFMPQFIQKVFKL